MHVVRTEQVEPEEEVDRADLHGRERAREVQVHELDSLHVVYASENAA